MLDWSGSGLRRTPVYLGLLSPRRSSPADLCHVPAVFSSIEQEKKRPQVVTPASVAGADVCVFQERSVTTRV